MLQSRALLRSLQRAAAKGSPADAVLCCRLAAAPAPAAAAAFARAAAAAAASNPGWAPRCRWASTSSARPQRGSTLAAAAGDGEAGADADDADVAAAAAGKPLRAERLLANLGYGKRSECTVLIKRGRLTLASSGKAVKVGEKVRAADVLLDGEALDPPPPLVVLLHKPVGYVVTSPDDERVTDPVVYDLLPERFGRRRPFLSAVGRLDKETSGLLLLTDDGQLLHRIKSPSKRIWKVYVATLDAPLSPQEVTAAARRFASGTLTLPGDRSPLLPAALQVAEDGLTAEVALAEGRYHQVRRMFTAVGREVITLHRRAVGSLTLEGLPEGEWRLGGPTDLDLVFGGPDLQPESAAVAAGGKRRRGGADGSSGAEISSNRSVGSSKAAGSSGSGGEELEAAEEGLEDEEEEEEGLADPEEVQEQASSVRRFRDSERWRRRRAAMRREVGTVLEGR